MNDTTPVTDAISAIKLAGNIIHRSWFQTIKTDCGKADMLGINILSELIYWHENSVEESNGVIQETKKFRADKLQKSYGELAEVFSVSKRQVTQAIDRLEKRGLLTREFRTLLINGVLHSNVLFIELVPDAVLAITHPRAKFVSGVQEEKVAKEGGIAKKSDTPPLTKKSDTNTRTTVLNINNIYTSKIDLEPKPSLETKQKTLESSIIDVFEHWQAVMGKQKSRLEEKRRRAITKALKNFTVEELKQAITGCSKSPWHMGQIDKGARYNGLQTILLDDERIEKFMEFALNPPKVGVRQAYPLSAAERESRAFGVTKEIVVEKVARWRNAMSQPQEGITQEGACS